MKEVVTINSEMRQFVYLLLIIVACAYYIYESYTIKVKLLSLVEFYNKYLKTVINIKIEQEYFGEKERLWHGKDSVVVENEDDLTFLITRIPIEMLGDKERARVLSYFYFSDEFRILGELDTKISPEVNSYLDDNNLKKVLKKYWKPYGVSKNLNTN